MADMDEDEATIDPSILSSTDANEAHNGADDAEDVRIQILHDIYPQYLLE